MRSAGPIFSAAHRSAAPFVDLARTEGPFVSLYLDTSPDVELAPTMIETRWKNARRALIDQGTPESVVAAIEAVIDGAQTRGSALAVIAHESGLLHVDHHPEPPARDISVLAPLPRIAPLLEWRQSVAPHVVVVTDRTGADITAVSEPGDDITTTVQANDVAMVTKVQPGGWSQPRYQRRVENAWEQGASAVAEVVAMSADDVHAEIIVVAGDVRAVELLQKALPNRLADKVTVIDGGRGPDGSDTNVALAVHRMVATAAASDTVEILSKFREERGQDDRASDGPAATLAALARAQVETLLVHDDPDDERTAWFGPSPEQVGIDRETVAAMGAEPMEGRLVDVAIRAALGTGAGIWLVPAAGGPTAGLGGVLRWASS